MKKYGLIFGMLETNAQALEGKIKECMTVISSKDNLFVTDLDSEKSYLYIRLLSIEENLKTITTFFQIELGAFLAISFVIENDEAIEQEIQFGSIEETELNYLIAKVLRLRKKTGEIFQSIIV